MSEQTRRTNILVGNEILTQIDDSQNVTHHNGVMKVEITKLPDFLPLGAHMELAHYQAEHCPAFREDGGAWKMIASKDDLAGVSATWDTLTGKPATYPPDDHQHVRQWLSLPVYFHGALTAGMTRLVIIPPGIQSATLLSLTCAFGNTGSASYTTFGIEAFLNYEWVSFLSNPAFSAMGISAGGSPVGSFGIQNEINVGRVVLPKADWRAEELLRISLVNIAPDASDATVYLNFDAQTWPFDPEE